MLQLIMLQLKVKFELEKLFFIIIDVKYYLYSCFVFEGIYSNKIGKVQK